MRLGQKMSLARLLICFFSTLVVQICSAQGGVANRDALAAGSSLVITVQASSTLAKFTIALSSSENTS